MAGLRLSSNRLGSLVLAALLVGAVGCEETLPPIMGTTSLRVELISPTITGDIDNRLPDTARTLTVEVTALDAQGNLDTSLTGDIDLYVHFLGGLSPDFKNKIPLTTGMLNAGVSGQITVDLPEAFGKTFLWIEDAVQTFATGTSDPLWYRDPWIVDVSEPDDEMSLVALEESPLEGKQVVVRSSRYGDSGRLVVTAIYADSYTLSDVQCQDAAGTPPCVAGDYDHILIFSFSRAEDEDGRPIERGHAIDGFAGAVSEFNGLTEIGFPRTFLSDDTIDTSRLPPPVVIQTSWLNTRIEMERVEAALIAVDGATLCPIDEDFETFGQWKLDLGLGCDDGMNVISGTEAADFDPAMYVGQIMPRVVGTLRPINIGSFHVWIMYPRDIGDITLP